jgi:uncharacterized Zn finger protein
MSERPQCSERGPSGPAVPRAGDMSERPQTKPNNKRRRQPQKKQQQQRKQPADSAVQKFWGDPEPRPAATTPIRPTPDPGALVKSLGNPPLSPAATHQLAVVYEEAVRAATALAAANGLLDVDEPS